MYHYSGQKYYTNPADPAREDDGLFGPGSMTWRVMDNHVMWVAGFRALYLQGLHPRVMRATWQNSSFADPAEAWGRLFRTRMFVMTRTFGTTAEAERAGRRVRKIHESISGTGPGGASYRIDEPDLLLWVHNAEVASVIDVARRSGSRSTRRCQRAARCSSWSCPASVPSRSRRCRTGRGECTAGLAAR
jgi:uncharacterized protein (DUF2236 family)